MTDKPGRARRIFLILPLAIGVLLLVGYTVLWFYGKGIMREEIDNFIGDQEAYGNIVTYDQKEIRGFPIALRAQIDNFRWTDPGNWDWSGEVLNIIAMPTDPTRLIFAPRGPQKIILPEDILGVTPNDLRVGIGNNKYSAEGTEVMISSADDQTLSLGSFKANWLSEEPGSWVMVASARNVTYRDADDRDVILPGLNVALSHEPDDGRGFRIEGSEIAFDDGSDGPPTLLKVDGKIGIDGAGYPEGQFTVTYRDERKLLTLLSRFNAITPEDRDQVAGMLQAYRAGKTEATVSFAMRQGELFLNGMVPLTDLPKIQ